MTEPQRPTAPGRPDRLARALSAVAIVVAVLGVVAALVRQGDDDAERAASSSTTSSMDDADASTSSSSSSSSSSTSTTSSTIDPLTTTTAAGSPGSTTSTTAPAAAGPCRNSRESQFAGRTRPAGCGAFAWVPTPLNQPAALHLTGPGEIYTGETAQFRVDWSDADAPVGAVRITGLGDGCLGDCSKPAPAPCTDEPIGKWDAPAKAKGSGTATIDASDLAPGTYSWTVTVDTRSAEAPAACLDDPWASTVSGTGVLVVAPR